MFTPNYVYLRPNRKRLSLPLQIQLSEKPKRFCCFFIGFLEFKLNLQHFQKKKNKLHSLSIPEIIDSERRGYLNA